MRYLSDCKEKNNKTFNKMKLVEYNKKNAHKSKYPPSYPNEMMVKIFSSNYYSKINIKPFHRNRILEIGSFSGNNLRYFIENGFQSYGVEINQQLVDLGVKNLKRLKIKPPLIKIGTNTQIPFKKNFFDTLVSVNTIHYNSGNDIHRALCEYRRVLKKDGVLYLETAGKKHFARGKRVGILSYKTKLKDFRKNHIFGYFDNKLHLKKILKSYFDNVEIFEKFEKTNVNLHFYIAVCK
jgi:SAM-dependent methyltransferase